MQRAFASDIDSQSKILLTFVCFARLGIETKMAGNITPKVCFQPVLYCRTGSRQTLGVMFPAIFVFYSLFSLTGHDGS